jgi:hypothetical protein
MTQRSPNARFRNYLLIGLGVVIVAYLALRLYNGS